MVMVVRFGAKVILSGGKRDANSRMPVSCSVSSLISSLVMVIIAEILRSDDLKVKGLLLMAVKSTSAAEMNAHTQHTQNE